MTGQLHPNILGALDSLWALGEQWQHLADLLEPGTPQRRPTVRLSAQARAELDRQTRAERLDLVETVRQGLKPSGTGKTPVVLSVLDVQLEAVRTVMDAAWRVFSDLAHEPWRIPLVLPTPYRGAGDTDHQRFHHAANYLRITLPDVHPDLAGDIGRDLHTAAQQAQRATGHAPTRHDLHDPCPACGDRFLQATTWGTDNAIVTCRCRCWGTNCGCQRPGRIPQARHIWQAAEFGQLTRLLQRREAA